MKPSASAPTEMSDPTEHSANDRAHAERDDPEAGPTEPLASPIHRRSMIGGALALAAAASLARPTRRRQAATSDEPIWLGHL
ncbi:MAG: hypothetical protein AAGC55_11570 [Myxococcota bacterium]